MRTILLVATCVVMLLTQGCIMTYMAVTNSVGTPIAVTSGQTGKSYRIGDGQTRMIPHTAGTLDVETDDGRHWRYPNVCSIDGEKSSHFLFWGKIVKKMIVVESQAGEPQAGQ